MKVKILYNSINELDETAKERLSRTIKLDRNESLEIGNIYTVQAVGNWKDRLNYYIQTEEDDQYPTPVPAEFCLLIDSSLPKNWEVGTRENSEFSQFLLSFPEWARDPTFYEYLIDGNLESISLYLRHKL